LADALTNEDLAKVVGMSTNAFIRFFHRSAGVSPQAFVRARRIERAGVSRVEMQGAVAERALNELVAWLRELRR
jgi:AraC-like DNA-binding protein